MKISACHLRTLTIEFCLRGELLDRNAIFMSNTFTPPPRKKTKSKQQQQTIQLQQQRRQWQKQQSKHISVEICPMLSNLPLRALSFVQIFLRYQNNVKSKSLNTMFNRFPSTMGVAIIACFGLFMTSVYADITGTTPSSGTCLCVTGTNVNARASGKKFDHLIFLFVSFEHMKNSNLNSWK